MHFWITILQAGDVSAADKCLHRNQVYIEEEEEEEEKEDEEEKEEAEEGAIIFQLGTSWYLTSFLPALPNHLYC